MFVSGTLPRASDHRGFAWHISQRRSLDTNWEMAGVLGDVVPINDLRIEIHVIGIESDNRPSSDFDHNFCLHNAFSVSIPPASQ